MDMNGIGMSSLPYMLASVLFFLLAVRLISQDARSATRRANRYLGLLCLAFALIEMDEFIQVNNLPFSYYVLFEKVQAATHLLLGPLTFLYLNAMSLHPKVTHSGYRHFTLFILGLILMWLPISDEMGWRLFVILYLTSLLPYIYCCFKGLKDFDLEAKKQLSDLHHHNLMAIKVWVYMMTFMCAYVVLSPLYKWLFDQQEGPIDIHYGLALFTTYLVVKSDFTSQLALSDVAYLVDYRRVSLAKKGSSTDSITDIQQAKEQQGDFNKILLDDKVSNAQIKESRLDFIALDQQVKESKLYLKNGLSLADLAQASGYSSNQISALINQDNGQCFYDYVNQYRIDEAKLLLVKSPAKAIVDVAIASGFNSKSAFYTAFSKQGIGTPGEFRRQHKELSLTVHRE